MCNGTEEYSLTQCSYNPITSQECFVGNHSAAVVCRQCTYVLPIVLPRALRWTTLWIMTIVGFIPVCREGDVRLVNRSFTSTGGLRSIGGVVQVCVNREYGYVCTDDWDNREAEVVCRSFGYRAPYFGMILCYKESIDSCCMTHAYEIHKTCIVNHDIEGLLKYALIHHASY